MALSYFNDNVVKGKDYILNHYRHKRIKDKHLLTTDHGGWVALDDCEFKKILRYDLDDELFRLLEEKGIILTTNNINRITKNYIERYSFLFSGASLHIIVPTLRCNQKCVYCHSAAKNISDKEYDMDEETAKKTLEFIFQSPSKDITIEFQGGEPLLNFDIFRYIVTEAKKMNKRFKKDILFSLVTNLTCLKKEYWDFIKKENIEVCTSLDGPKKVHDANRIYENDMPTYEDVIDKISKIERDTNLSVPALSVTTRQSLPFWKDIVDEYVRIGNKSIQIKYIDKLGFAEEKWKYLDYPIADFIKFWRNTVNYIIELNKKGIKIKPRYLTTILKKILSTRDPCFLDLRSPCGLITGQIVYKYDGEIYCCDEGRGDKLFIIGNVKSDSYIEVISSKKSMGLIDLSLNDSLLCDACAYKPYCGLCPVICYAENNNLIPKISSFSKCKIIKAQLDFVFEKLLFEKDIRNIFFDWYNDWGLKNSFYFDINRTILKKYDLNIEKVIEFEGGFNKNYLIKCKEGDKFLKIYKKLLGNKEESKKRLMEINNFLIYLKKKGVKSIYPEKNINNEFFFNVNSLLGSVYNYVEGKFFGGEDEELISAAKELSRLHLASKEFNGAISKNFLNIKKTLDLLEIKSADQLFEPYEELIKKEISLSLNILKDDVISKLNKGVIHGDYRFHNLLFKNKQVEGILDFELLSKGPFIYDLSVALYSIKEAYNKDIFKKMKLFYEVYNKGLLFSEFERGLIVRMIKIFLLSQIHGSLKADNTERVHLLLNDLIAFSDEKKVLKKIFD
ncbi:His-Xaa-Ser system radical SAM maturase HxsB [Candidatus Woesearchaeota archaeon]|nr:His-Xaa-Ser system radical SAM maturase HxsB [Candidatus Woesearchaeota archaeon]